MLTYAYTHSQTQATTGYFSCEPTPPLPLDAALAFLCEHPLDDFMRRHLLLRMGSLPGGAVLAAFGPWEHNLPAPLQALAQELALIAPPLAEVLAPLLTAPLAHDAVNTATSLIFLRHKALPDAHLHKAWAKVFRGNIQEHRSLQSPETIGLPPLYAQSEDTWVHLMHPEGCAPECFTAPFTHALAECHTAAQCAPDAPFVRPPSSETAALAQERLEACGIIAGQEMRHIASLSPVALQRPWQIDLEVSQGRHHHRLHGTATTYGRGLSVPDARASCLMEMVERASMYFSVAEGHILHRAAATPLRSATRSELIAEGLLALDPNHFPLEVPYTDAPLLWMPGHTAAGQGIVIPAQMAGLFCNLDEISLFDAMGSTGIATGTSLEEAKLAALTEIIERDAEATTPFHKENCFTLTADDPVVGRLLASYRALGVQVQFQNLTGPLGVPVYQCFVMSRKGAIARGYGAGLSARRAILSALTETPFPYPDGGPSGPLLRNLPERSLESLPDYTLPTPAASLALLEDVLTKNSRPPAYAVLTHERLLFPVVRAFIPGMELAADSDAFSRVPLRLYEHYLDLFT